MSERTKAANHNASRGASRNLTAFFTVASVSVLTAAVSPALAGSVTTEIAKLLASDGQTNDHFGRSVAINGDTAIVGSPFQNGSGSAYVFVRNAGGAWIQQAKLSASDGQASDVFGGSVALSGDTAVVGAPYDDDNGTNSGSAYVFVRNTNGVWTQQAKLLTSDGQDGDISGSSVAIVGDTALVGTPLDDDNNVDSGSVYVFVRDANGVWTQQPKLLASDGSFSDLFGGSLAFNGDTAVIGAWLDDPIGTDSGSAYVFVRDAGGVWTQQAKLLPTDGAASDRFGISVAVSGGTALVGADFDDDNGMDSGSAYVFVLNTGGIWMQQGKLLALDGASQDQFGSSVALSGDRAVTGASSDDDNGMDSGSAYVFVRDAGGVWTQQTKLLASDGAMNDVFGNSVAVTGATVIVAASLDDNNNGTNSGSAYVFDLPATGNGADLNGDGVVDGADLATLLTQWGTNGPADLNNDGVVNGADLATLLTNWG